MPGFWDGVRKAAAVGVVKAQLAAEQTARRLELQRRIAQHEAELTQRYAAIGRATAAAVRAGASPPPGVTVDLDALTAAEAELGRLRAQLQSTAVR